MKKNICMIVFLLLLSPMLFAQSVLSFIKLTAIDGESSVNGYDTFIEIRDVSYNFSNDYLAFPSNPGLNRTNAFPVSGVISFTKSKSKSSTVFFSYATKGITIIDLEIHFTKQINGNWVAFTTYKAKSAFIVAVTDKDGLSERISIDVSKIQITYVPALPNSPIVYGWDFIAKTPWNGN